MLKSDIVTIIASNVMVEICAKFYIIRKDKNAFEAYVILELYLKCLLQQ